MGTYKIERTTQHYTSAITSVNTKKLPILHQRINLEAIARDYGKKGFVIDYGCGKAILHIQEYVTSRGWGYLAYDPYWCVGDSWDKICSKANFIKEMGFPVIGVCSNVLNVIDSREEISRIKDRLYGLSTNKMAFFSIYAGDKSGHGRETRPDCWQRNEPVENYITAQFETIRSGILTSGFSAQYVMCKNF